MNRKIIGASVVNLLRSRFDDFDSILRGTFNRPFWVCDKRGYAYIVGIKQLAFLLINVEITVHFVSLSLNCIHPFSIKH